MTYAKAINALVGERLINSERAVVAVEALKDHSVKFTYPDWAESLAEAGLLARLDVGKAAIVMQEAEEGGELLASATKCVSGIFSYMSANYVEMQVLNWCKSLLDFPASAAGQLTGGCSAANLIGLATARNTRAGYDLRREGLHAVLKAWMTIKEQGTLKYGRLIQQNIDQAHYLGEQVKAAPELELALPVSLNIVCFRYIHPDLDDDALNALNKQIEIELQELGFAVPSVVKLWGKQYLHVAITNHRSHRDTGRISTSLFAR